MDKPLKFECHIEITADIKLVDCLVLETDLSKTLVKQALQKGCGWVTKGKHTQRVRRADKMLQTGHTLHFYYDEDVLATVPDQPVLIADEGEFSVWIKSAGMYSQGSRWGDHCTINRWVETHLEPQRPAFIVHRLDRAASGLMLLAHSKKMAAYFSTAFAERSIEKTYRAIAHGRFVVDNNSLVVNEPIDGKTAKSVISLIEYDDSQDQSLLAVTIETGRKHQIRRHLVGLNHPVVGDALYNVKGDHEGVGLELTAVSLSFNHPVLNTKLTYILPEQYCPKLS